MSEANKAARISYLQGLVVEYRSKLDAFVRAYEASDATNYSDEMRNAYALASVSHDPRGVISEGPKVPNIEMPGRGPRGTTTLTSQDRA